MLIHASSRSAKRDIKTR